MRRFTLTLLFFGLFIAATAHAQDAPTVLVFEYVDTAVEQGDSGSCALGSSSAATGDATPEAEDAPLPEAVFLQYENALVSLFPSAVYTYDDAQGNYIGIALVPDPMITFASTLTIHDDGTMEEQATVETFGCVTSYTRSYTPVENTRYEVWTETERTLLDETLFTECLPSAGAPPFFTTPDLLVLFQFNDDDTLTVLNRVYTPTDDGTVYESIDPGDPDGEMNVATTRTLTYNAEDAVTLHVAGVVTERTDCQIVYESSLVPLTDDLTTLNLRAAENAEMLAPPMR
jgi:hypothetical protein